MKVFLGTAAGAACLMIVFLAFFYVPDDHAEVVGSIRYTDDEIRRMVFRSFRDHNALYLAFRKKVVEPDVYFVDSIEVEYQGHNRLRLQVNEDMPIAYIEQDGYDYYFNSDGIVLEAMLMSENDPVLHPAQEEPEFQAEPDRQEALSGMSDVGLVEQSMAEAVADTSFHAALTDVTRIEGLTEQRLKVGSEIHTEDPVVFHTILALTKIFSKFDLKPDYITYNEKEQLVLHYAEVDVNIGGEAYLEAKMARTGVILPQLEGMKGVLHLENWTEDTVNIVFSPASEEEEAEEADTEGAEETWDGTEGEDMESQRADAEEFYRTFLSQAPGNSADETGEESF